VDAHDAAEVVAFLEQDGLEVYMDGGWAVDALLGVETRQHDDPGHGRSSQARAAAA